MMFSSSHSSSVRSSSRPKSSRSTSRRRPSRSPRSCRPIGCRPLGANQSRRNRRSADTRPLLPHRSEKVRHAFVVKSIKYRRTLRVLSVLSSEYDYCLLARPSWNCVEVEIVFHIFYFVCVLLVTLMLARADAAADRVQWIRVYFYMPGTYLTALFENSHRPCVFSGNRLA